MKVCARQFNLYFALAAVLILLGGCQTASQKALHKKEKEIAALRVHIELDINKVSDPGTGQTISVLRSDPVAVTIEPDPILTEANIIAAQVVDLPGGFAVKIQFDEMGTWTLEQYSAANPGKHFVIFGQWGEKLVDGRWLAAPLIVHRIGDGILTFTPDASREEAARLVLGLNNIARKTKKGAF